MESALGVGAPTTNSSPEWRMGGDSNPRNLLGSYAFQAYTIDRSVTHPKNRPPGMDFPNEREGSVRANLPEFNRKMNEFPDRIESVVDHRLDLAIAGTPTAGSASSWSSAPTARVKQVSRRDIAPVPNICVHLRYLRTNLLFRGLGCATAAAPEPLRRPGTVSRPRPCIGRNERCSRRAPRLRCRRQELPPCAPVSRLHRWPPRAHPRFR